MTKVRTDPATAAKLTVRRFDEHRYVITLHRINEQLEQVYLTKEEATVLARHLNAVLAGEEKETEGA